MNFLINGVIEVTESSKLLWFPWKQTAVLSRQIIAEHECRTMPKEKKGVRGVTTSALKVPIDYKSLEEELHAALAADELYRLQNDAKIRAVEQDVPTYEHFRQMASRA